MKNLFLFPAGDCSPKKLWQHNRPHSAPENTEGSKNDTADDASQVNKIKSLVDAGHGDTVKKNLTPAQQKIMKERANRLMEMRDTLRKQKQDKGEKIRTNTGEGSYTEKFEGIVGGIGNEDGSMSVENWKEARKTEKEIYLENAKTEIDSWNQNNNKAIDAWKKEAQAEKEAYFSDAGSLTPQEISSPQQIPSPKQTSGPKQVRLNQWGKN